MFVANRSIFCYYCVCTKQCFKVWPIQVSPKCVFMMVKSTPIAKCAFKCVLFVMFRCSLTIQYEKMKQKEDYDKFSLLLHIL